MPKRDLTFVSTISRPQKTLIVDGRAGHPSLLSSKSSTAVGAVIVLLVVGAVASIGYYQLAVAKPPTSSTTTSSTTTTQVACTPATCAYVNITSGAASCVTASSPCGFSPATVVVVMGVNNTVIWFNQDATVHTVTSNNGTAVQWGITSTCASFSLVGLCPGGNYSYTFSSPGTYLYHCLYHPGMLAEVIVKAATTAAAPRGSD